MAFLSRFSVKIEIGSCLDGPERLFRATFTHFKCGSIRRTGINFGACECKTAVDQNIPSLETKTPPLRF